MNLLSILLQFDPNPTKMGFTRPYHTMQGVPPHIVVTVLSLFVAFCIYVGIRVWISIKKDKKEKNKKVRHQRRSHMK